MIHQGDAEQFREAAVLITRSSVGRKTCGLFVSRATGLWREVVGPK